MRPSHLPPRRAIIAYSAVAADADASTQDILDQVRMADEALTTLGLPHEAVAVENGRVWEAIDPDADALVFALLEAPPGRAWEQAAATAVLELLGLPFTGASAAAIWLTTDKVVTRASIAAVGLPVAAGGALDLARPAVLERVPPPWILKPAWEDASVGLEGSPVCGDRRAALERGAWLAARFPGQPILVEHFLPGREFNVALLEEAGGVRVLPIAEIAFVDFPPGAPALVGYEAKWETGSFADTHTVRRFPGEGDAALLTAVARLSSHCWQTFGLSGYARVDLRLDERGEPNILEVNANPCLSPGAGFLAAAEAGGLAAAEVVARIVDAACRRAGRPAPFPPLERTS
jgi:D-alanine-D-alanine ligase